MLNAGDTNGAFERVLGSSSVDTLAWLCAQLQPNNVFGAGPLLSQGVILSLIQQLGCDLQRDTPAKVSWICEAALSLDRRDPLLVTHMPAVLTNLVVQLQQYEHTCDEAVRADVRFCARLVQSVLR